VAVKLNAIHDPSTVGFLIRDMSLDRDIAQRLQDKYDPVMADEAREWIESCLGEALPDEDLMDTLKDGTVLCRLLNEASPGSTKYKASRMPFVQVIS
jgi:hypothetical protein